MTGAPAGIASTRRPRTHQVLCSRALLLAALLGTGPVFAQSWRVIPSISVAGTLTDNVALAPDPLKESDFITQISPGIRLEKPGGRLRLNANYRATGLFYANNSDNNDIQNSLDASASLEAIENWFFIDARASISQQILSAFGGQANIAPENINANRAETMAYQVSPYIRGRLGATTDYQLRYSLTGSHVRGNPLGDTLAEDMFGTITGAPNPAGLGWGLNASFQRIHPDDGRDVTARRVGGSLLYQFTPQLRGTLLGGWETNNFSAANDASAATYGAQVEWRPTERTRLLALGEKRPSVNTHQFSFEHRSRLTAWRFADSKSVTSFANQLALAQIGTAFDLFFDALATRFPDPAVRRVEVERILLQNGIPRDLALAAAFVTSRAVVQRSRIASVALLGVRNTVTFGASLIESRAVESALGVPDDFSRTSEIEQRSLSADWSYRFSPLTSLNLLASHIQSTGAAPTDLETTQITYRLLLSHQFGPKTYGTLAARYIRFDGTGLATDFREKAITGSLVVTF